ncbi:hypothetical protein ACS0TY_018985 [Phlomoides rotata]
MIAAIGTLEKIDDWPIPEILILGYGSFLLKSEITSSLNYRFIKHMVFAGNELLLDSFPYKEIDNGVLWEVGGKWVVKGSVDVDIGANPSVYRADEEEGTDDQVVKVVDIVNPFRLQEHPPFDKK